MTPGLALRHFLALTRFRRHQFTRARQPRNPPAQSFDSAGNRLRFSGPFFVFPFRGPSNCRPGDR